MVIKYLKYSLQLLFLSSLNVAIGQSIQINEVVSSNSLLIDIDGESPDWIELYNSSNSPVSLTEWSITDNEEQPKKWIFEDATIPANGYMILMASGKDRQSSFEPRTLINQGDEWRYIVPNQNLNSSWTSRDFNDSSWNTGLSGFGYADSDDATVLPEGTRSIFLRKEFQIDDTMILTMI